MSRKNIDTPQPEATPGAIGAAAGPVRTVAIAGATGFVGRALCRDLAARHRIVGLTRSGAPAATGAGGEPSVEWRRCDLFRLREVEQALGGVDVAIYLVHSMLPTARLTQSHFADLDLVMADNFARAARRAGVRHVVYLGGLIPEGEALSPHLASRLEVERTLASRGTPTTALRAGLIVGPEGSSLSILLNLVGRLPFMILPRWTESDVQPVALRDVVRAVAHVLEEPGRWVGSFDIGGPDVLSYRAMMRRTARLLGLRRTMVGVPFFSPRLSRLWVSIFGGAPPELVNPLIETLRHDMVAADNPLQAWLRPGATGFATALAEAWEARGGERRPALGRRRRRARAAWRQERTVRSIQRLPLPPGLDARWAADEYLRFLPRFVRPLLRVELTEDGRCSFHLAGSRLRLLELQRTPRSSPDRQALDVVGGALVARGAAEPGRLEFREVLDGHFLLAAVHDYRPALPWLLYSLTQARVHLWVMRGFRRHLERLAAARALPATAPRP